MEHRRNDFQKTLRLSEVRWVGQASVDALPPSFRVLVWNIEHGHDIAEIGRVLDEVRPHIALLQEVDWGNGRTGYRDVLAELVDGRGYVGAFGIEFVEIEDPERAKHRAIGAGGGATGNAILSVAPLLSAQRLALPRGNLNWEQPSESWQRRVVTREPRIGERMAVLAGIPLEAGGVIHVASAHLEDKAGIQTRRLQFEHLVDAVGDGPAVVGGDLNTLAHGLGQLSRWRSHRDPESRAKPLWMREAVWWTREILPETGLTDPFDPVDDVTFRVGRMYAAKLDWLLARGFRVTTPEVGAREPSDHNPLWATYELVR